MDISEFLIGLGSTEGTYIPLLIFLTAFLDTFVLVGFFVQGMLVMIFSAYFYIRGDVGLVDVWFFAFLGEFLGDQCSYVVGHVFGEKVLNMWPLNKKPDWILRGKKTVHKYGVWSVIVGRFFAPIRSVVPVVCSVFALPYRKFLIADFIACALWACFWAAILGLAVSGVGILEGFLPDIPSPNTALPSLSQ